MAFVNAMLFNYLLKHGMFSCYEHWNGEHGVNMSFCTEVDWVMHGNIAKWPLTPSLSRFKKHPSCSLEPSQPSYFVGTSLELHLVAAWPDKPYRIGCEGPVQSMSARIVHYSHKNECSVGPNHFTLVSFTLVVQVRLYFGSDGNRCRLTPSLVVLLQPAATHLDGIIENNKLQTWQKTLGNFFSSNTLNEVWCAASIRRINWASAVWIADRESLKCMSQNVMLMRGYGRVKMRPLS